jgi:trigger factor
MKMSLEEINPVQRRLTIQIPTESVDKAFDIVLKKIQKKAKIDGYRPGKVPLSILKRNFQDYAAAEVAEILVKDKLFEAMANHSLRAVGMPMVDDLGTLPTVGQPYEFKALIDVMPELSIQNYKDIELTVNKYLVTDASVERELKSLARTQAKTKPVDDENALACEKHLVSLSHTASIDGQEVDHLKADNLSILIGEGEVHQAIETALIGMKKGESKQVTITLDDDYEDKALSGKDVNFNITLHQISEINLPTLDDEFAKDLDHDSFENLRGRIREYLEENANARRRQELEGQLLKKIIEKNPFEVPPTMVDSVIDRMIKEFGINDKKILQNALTNDNIRKSLLPQAKEQVQYSLLLWDIAEKEKIQISDDELRSNLRQQLGEKVGGADAYIEAQISHDGNRLKENLMLQRALEYLLSHTKVTDIPVEI